MSDKKPTRPHTPPSKPAGTRDGKFHDIDRGRKTGADSGVVRPANVDSVFHKPVVTKPPPKK